MGYTISELMRRGSRQCSVAQVVQQSAAGGSGASWRSAAKRQRSGSPYGSDVLGRGRRSCGRPFGPLRDGRSTAMLSVGVALLGIVLGAAGAELLRACRPELIKKIEDRARSFINRFVDRKPGPKRKK